MSPESNPTIPENIPTPEVVTNPECNYAWYIEHKNDYLFANPIFTREPLTHLKELVENCKNGESYVNDFLNFIDPRARVNIGGMSYLSTLGFFFDQMIDTVAQERGITSDEYYPLLREIDARRMDILGAVGANHPYLWSSQKDIVVKPRLDTTKKQPSDLVGGYINAVQILFDKIETRFDKEKVIAILAFEIARTEYNIDKKIGRGGEPLTENFKEYLKEGIRHRKIGIDRLCKLRENPIPQIEK
jgi:hypothetical protein